MAVMMMMMIWSLLLASVLLYQSSMFLVDYIIFWVRWNRNETEGSVVETKQTAQAGRSEQDHRQFSLTSFLGMAFRSSSSAKR